jgi:hypothetical protein
VRRFEAVPLVLEVIGHVRDGFVLEAQANPARAQKPTLKTTRAKRVAAHKPGEVVQSTTGILGGADRCQGRNGNQRSKRKSCKMVLRFEFVLHKLEVSPFRVRGINGPCVRRSTIRRGSEPDPVGGIPSRARPLLTPTLSRTRTTEAQGGRTAAGPRRTEPDDVRRRPPSVSGSAPGWPTRPWRKHVAGTCG